MSTILPLELPVQSSAHPTLSTSTATTSTTSSIWVPETPPEPPHSHITFANQQQQPVVEDQQQHSNSIPLPLASHLDATSHDHTRSQPHFTPSDTQPVEPPPTGYRYVKYDGYDEARRSCYSATSDIRGTLESSAPVHWAAAGIEEQNLTSLSPSAFPHDFNGRRESDPYPFTFFAPPQNSYSDPHVGPPPSLYHRNSYSHPPRAITGYRTLHPSSQPMSPSCSGTPSLTECSSPATSRAGSLVEGTPYFGGFATDQFDSLPRDEGAFPLPLLPPQQAAGYYDYSPRAPMPYASNTYAQYEINPHGKRTYSTEGKGDSPSRYNHLYSPTQSLTSPQAALAAFSFQSSPGSGASTPIVPQEDTMPSYDPYNPLHRAEPLSPRSVLPEGRGLAPSANLYTSNARLPKRHCPSIADDQPPGIAARRGDNPHQLHLFNLNPSPLNSPDKLSQRYPLPSPQSPYNFSPQQQHPFGYASSAPFPSPTAPDYPPRPSTASSTSASTSRPTPVAAGPPRQHQRSSSYPCDDVDACHVTPPAADFQVHEDKMPRKQKLRFEEDQYTPLWVRGQGHGKEGYGSLCPEGGKWLQLKNSAYWYHRQFQHGVSSVSGHYFLPPLETRPNEDGTATQGLCHSCGEWTAYQNLKSSGGKGPTLWFRHSHQCHAYYSPKRDASKNAKLARQ